ncbi:MAG: DUF5703 domain-containing protein [Chitinophagaceae bacterium]
MPSTLISFTLPAQPPPIKVYSVSWTSQSKNSSESMPCGGGDIGLNVWVENGEVLFYHHRTRNNIEDIFDYTVRLEGMNSVKSQLFNPIKNNTIGGSLQGTNMKPAGINSGNYADVSFTSLSIKSIKFIRSQQIKIGLHVERSNTLADFEFCKRPTNSNLRLRN